MATRRPRCGARGFTLIELLVVLIIISIIITFATLAVRQDPATRLQEEGRRLARLLDLASEEAVLGSRVLGTYLFQHGYGFYDFNGSDWAPQSADKTLRQRALPEAISLRLYIDGLPVALERDPPEERIDSEKKVTPQLYLFATGERIPAEVRLVEEREEGPPLTVSIEIPLLGSITSTRVEE